MKKVTFLALCGLFHTACSTAEKVKPAAGESSLNWGNIIMGIFVLGFFYVVYHAINIGIAWAKMNLLGTTTDSLSDAAADVAGAKTVSSASTLDKLKTVEEKHAIRRAYEAIAIFLAILIIIWIGRGFFTGHWSISNGVGPALPLAYKIAIDTGSHGTIDRDEDYILDSTRLANNTAAWAMREANRHEEKMAKEARKMKQVEKSGSSSNKPWYVSTPKKSASKNSTEYPQDNYGEMEANAGNGESTRKMIPSRLAK